MRAFLAIELPDALREELSRVASVLRPAVPGARFVPPENLHLTVRFLAEVSTGDLRLLLASLAPGVSGLRGFGLRVRGVGAFPSGRRPRVLGAGIVDAPEELGRLSRLVEEKADAAGLAPASRPFAPHLTLARFKRPETRLAPEVRALREKDFGDLPVTGLTCFESRLSPGGASYRILDRLPLAPGGTAGLWAQRLV